MYVRPHLRSLLRDNGEADVMVVEPRPRDVTEGRERASKL